MRTSVVCYIFFVFLFSCHAPKKRTDATDSSSNIHNHILLEKPDSAGHVTCISTGRTTPLQLLTFADSLKGIPYKNASTDAAYGFDCSGFIAYVFNHFYILVPRSSIDYTFVHRQIRLKDAKPGDMILFTGTDTLVRKVGHMGIISSIQGDKIKFIHSTSGKDKGVTETAFNNYYKRRYVKTIRVFPQNDKFGQK
jgi:murein DD-endopeptidase / murein LD-carboxypeptidase